MSDAAGRARLPDAEGTAVRDGVRIAWARYGGELAWFVDAGLLVHDPQVRLRLTRRGMLLANEVMAVFIGPAVR